MIPSHWERKAQADVFDVTVQEKTVPAAPPPRPETERRRVEGRADRVLLAGSMLSGSFVAGPIGLFLVGYSFVLLRRAQQRGIAIRPWIITIMGTFCLVDAGVNFVAWGLELLPSHDSLVFRTFASGYGRLFDGAWYVDYNTRAIGGVSADNGEKALGIASVVLLFPMRVAASLAFLKMKRWGLHFMQVTSWCYAFLWIAYGSNMLLDFELRFGSSIFGVPGWWMFNMVYLTPFIMLPFLYQVDRRLFTD